LETLQHPVGPDAPQYIILDIVEDGVVQIGALQVVAAHGLVHLLGEREDILLVDVPEEAVPGCHVLDLVVVLH